MPASIVIISDDEGPPTVVPPPSTSHLTTTPKPRRLFSHVSPPALSKGSLDEYRQIAAQPLQIVDEVTEGRAKFYLSRTIAGYRKVSNDFFIDHQDEYGHLIDDYEELKHDGALPHIPKLDRNRLLGITTLPSDGESSVRSGASNGFYDRPKARKAAQKQAGGRRFVPASVPSHSSHESSSEASDEEDYSEQDDSSEPILRRSVRTKESRQKFGNHSPKKVSVPTRRTRSHRRRSGSHSSGEASSDFTPSSSGEDDIDVDSEYEEDGKPHGPKGKGADKKKRRPRPVRPAYGLVRSIEDLDAEDPLKNPTNIHRLVCEKCSKAPTHLLLNALRKRGGKKKKSKRRKGPDADLEMSSEDEATSLQRKGGWVRCLHCCVAHHWNCLGQPTRMEVLKAARAKEEDRMEEDGMAVPEKRRDLDFNETTDFVCASCMKTNICLGCEQPVNILEPSSEPVTQPQKARTRLSHSRSPSSAVGSTPSSPDSETDQLASSTDVDQSPVTLKCLLFRCITCKRAAHYEHLSPLDGLEIMNGVNEIARSYQKLWQCKDCIRWQYRVDKIIGYRLYPPNAIEPPRLPGSSVDIKIPLPREYLVKWETRSWLRLEWVPHLWLVSTHPQKLKNYLQVGTKAVGLLAPPVEEVLAVEGDLSSASRKPSPFESNLLSFEPIADPEAEQRVPRSWVTVDRVLDLTFWKPKPKKKRVTLLLQPKSDGNEKSNVVEIDEEKAALVKGEQPDPSKVETIAERETRTKVKISSVDLNDVVFGFFKWQELGFDEATWDSPPEPGSDGFEEYEKAYHTFIASRQVKVPSKSITAFQKFDGRKPRNFPLMPQPDFGSAMKLMPFQLEGLTWLFQCWHNHQASILADEMGLGKTVQIVSLLGHLIKSENCFPHLVIVPNSTISNWIREFERWVPGVRAVQYCGEANARKIIRDYELYRKDSNGRLTKELRYHVLVTTYDAVINPKEFNMIFKSVKRWETLIVDEGQRLKSESSLLFKRLRELNSIHRILMTGTPLNNNIRELFTLMNFLDEENWADLDELEEEYDDLDGDKVAQLHERLKPYFLRRVKVDVMQDLPPKIEVIVPISMSPLQKEVYKSLLSSNLELLGSLAKTANTRSGPAVKKGSLNNLLMQLRKCMQHPYLVERNLEDQSISNREQHRQLIDSSGKLRLLKLMLPKLKERGHRVLLFSQFKIALDIIEDFLEGEGYKYLRLDGDQKQSYRQKDMDLFNQEDSEYFIYILSTRAGGVGINLWSADTVIMFDPDFNPHQDLQAIARAHRMGQKKKVLVFKLMVKGAAEEKIIQAGKKKLVLDHLIVQKMDKDQDEDENVQNILSFGAKQLFEDQNDSADIIYNDPDVEKLIDKIEQEEPESPEVASGGMNFGFAKIWEATKDSLNEIDEKFEEDNSGYWEKRIALANAQKAKREAETSGRGAKRKAATAKPMTTWDDDLDLSPDRPSTKTSSKRKPHRNTSEDEEWRTKDGKEAQSSSVASSPSASEAGHLSVDDHELLEQSNSKGKGKSKVKKPDHNNTRFPNPLPAQPQSDTDEGPCNICGKVHSDGLCPNGNKRKTLVDLKAKLEVQLLLNHPPETAEELQAALETIHDRLTQLDVKTAATKARRLAKQQQGTTGGLPPQSRVPPAQNGSYSVLLSAQSTTSGNPSFGLPSSRLHERTLASQQLPAGVSAGGVKRSAPDSLVPRKRAKPEPTGRCCQLCGQQPFHLVKECPIVFAGFSSITAKLQELKQNPKYLDDPTYHALKRIHRQNPEYLMGARFTSSKTQR